MSKLQFRRGSYEITNTEQVKLKSGFPVRGNTNFNLKPAEFNPTKRRNSEVPLPAIRKNAQHGRKFSLIDRSEIKKMDENNPRSYINMRKDFEPEVQREESVSLPRIPSVTPEPEIIRQKGLEHEKEYPENNVNMFSSYRPKYCWCLRCQMMFTLFQAGDPALNMWGNYPCFRR